MNYGKAFTKAAAHCGLIRKRMAKEVGVSENYYYNLCSNNKPASLAMIENTAKTCDIKLSIFFKWGEE